ncbi:MAG: FAD-dependent oxidoreductase, partial [Rhizobiales bacterium]|nr:FAD-dependent oxidoreductase [Hyphomicrobiales bacterium]
AVIGAGAAGLCAAYELTKLGVDVHLYEMNADENLAVPVPQPFGRGYSWDWNARGANLGGFSNDYLVETGTPAVPDGAINQPTTISGKQIVDVGAMRYPYSHTTLRTYVDQIFKDDYYYGSEANVTSLWRDFRNPGIHTSTVVDPDQIISRPEDSDQMKYATAMYINGITADPSSTREFYLMEEGDTFAEMNASLKNVALKEWDFYFSETGEPIDNDSVGALTVMVSLYKAYTLSPTAVNEDAILNEWDRLKALYEEKTTYQVYVENNWDHLPADGVAFNAPTDSSIMDIYGTAGSGTGGIDVFWWTTFMENLRKTIHLDETQPSTFVGGTSYMLSPFLTHNVDGTAGNNLFNQASPNFLGSAVKKIERVTVDSVKMIRIHTEDIANPTRDFSACIMTVAPPAIRARIDIDPALLTNSASETIKRLRLTNSGKIAIHFPNNGDIYSQAFWMNRTTADPYNANEDYVVTTVTDLNIRQIYTFDNYHWGTNISNGTISTEQAELKAGTLLLGYTWDYNADSFQAMSDEEQVREAWRQMAEIYQDPANTRPFPEES